MGEGLARGTGPTFKTQRDRAAGDGRRGLGRGRGRGAGAGAAAASCVELRRPPSSCRPRPPAGRGAAAGVLPSIQPALGRPSLALTRPRTPALGPRALVGLLAMHSHAPAAHSGRVPVPHANLRPFAAPSSGCSSPFVAASCARLRDPVNVRRPRSLALAGCCLCGPLLCGWPSSSPRWTGGLEAESRSPGTRCRPWQQGAAPR